MSNKIIKSGKYTLKKSQFHVVYFWKVFLCIVGLIFQSENVIDS